MFIIDVIPLTKIPLPAPQVLSYFAQEKVGQGALVWVPLGKKEVAAFVKDWAPLEERKITIKKETFPLKKLGRIITKEEVLSPTQLQLAEWMRNHYLASWGPILKLFLPQRLSQRKTPLKTPLAPQNLPRSALSPASQSLGKKTLLLWQQKRGGIYKREIRRALNKKEQVLLLVPECHRLEEISNEPGLSSLFSSLPSTSVCLFHGQLKSSGAFEVWQKVRSSKTHLIIGTRSALFLPFQRLGLIIVEQEENPAYEGWGLAPRYDVREVALKLAEIHQGRVILGSELPSLNAFFRQKNGQYEAGGQGDKKRKGRRTAIEMVDMRREGQGDREAVFSQRLEQLVRGNIKQRRRSILFINRRGLATSLLCQECGSVIKCQACALPLTYHLEQKWALLRCHHCGKREAVPQTCPECHGWQLKLLGRGTQKVVTSLEKLFPKASILRLDSDSAPNLKKQKEMVAEFVKGGDILVATQLLLKFPPSMCREPFSALVGIVLIDPLLNLPDFRASERVFRILSRLQSFGKKMIIQTYNPNLSLFKHLRDEDEQAFFQEELRTRKALAYPPFSEIIRLSFTHKDNLKAQREAAQFKAALASRLLLPRATILGPAPGFQPKIRGQYQWHLVIKNQEGKVNLRAKLYPLLSPGWRVEVNPEELL